MTVLEDEKRTGFCPYLMSDTKQRILSVLFHKRTEFCPISLRHETQDSVHAGHKSNRILSVLCPISVHPPSRVPLFFGALPCKLFLTKNLVLKYGDRLINYFVSKTKSCLIIIMFGSIFNP